MQVRENIDLNEWQHIGKGDKVEVYQQVEVKLAAPGHIKAHVEGGEILVGYGTHFKLNFSEPVEISANQIAAMKGLPDRTVINDGEIFTNEDAREVMSPAEQMVTRALRRLQMKERAFMRKVKDSRIDGVQELSETEEENQENPETGDETIDETSEEKVTEQTET